MILLARCKDSPAISVLSALFERLRITTLGAVVGPPAAFKNVKQYLGALDWFGSVNSSLAVRHERVPDAGHHLNPGFPYSMSVASLLNGAVAQRLLPKPSIEDVLPLPIPPIAAMPEPAPAAVVKPREAVRKSPKKMAKPPSLTPKVASAAQKVASPAPKPSVEEVTQPSIAAKQPMRPALKKMVEVPAEPVQPAKTKSAAVNGKLVVRKSKKEVR
jgi:hypothetical protein